MIALTSWDIPRSILIAGLALMAGSLITFYVIQQRSTMFWGALSASCFILGAAVEEVHRFGSSIVTWRFYVYMAGLICGAIALWQALRDRRRRS